MQIKIELWQCWKRRKARRRVKANRIREEKQAAYKESLLSRRERQIKRLKG